MTPAPNVMRMPTFLLIQHGAVLNTEVLLKKLHTSKLREWWGFKVAVGYTGEDGKRHVAGIIADVAPLWGVETWAISHSSMGADAGLLAYIPARDSTISYVLHYLNVLLSDGHLYDIYNLPAPLTIKPAYNQKVRRKR